MRTYTAAPKNLLVVDALSVTTQRRLKTDLKIVRVVICMNSCCAIGSHYLLKWH